MKLGGVVVLGLQVGTFNALRPIVTRFDVPLGLGRGQPATSAKNT